MKSENVSLFIMYTKLEYIIIRDIENVNETDLKQIGLFVEYTHAYRNNQMHCAWFCTYIFFMDPIGKFLKMHKCLPLHWFCVDFHFDMSGKFGELILYV